MFTRPTVEGGGSTPTAAGGGAEADAAARREQSARSNAVRLRGEEGYTGTGSTAATGSRSGGGGGDWRTQRMMRGNQHSARAESGFNVNINQSSSNLTRKREAASRGRQAKGEDTVFATDNQPATPPQSNGSGGSKKKSGGGGWWSSLVNTVTSLAGDVESGVNTIAQDLTGTGNTGGNGKTTNPVGSTLNSLANMGKNLVNDVGGDIQNWGQNLGSDFKTVGGNIKNVGKDFGNFGGDLENLGRRTLSGAEWLGGEIEKHPVESAIVGATAAGLAIGAVFTGGADLAVAPEALAEAAAFGAGLNVGIGEVTSKLTTGKWQSLGSVAKEAALGGALGVAGAFGGAVIEAGLGRAASVIFDEGSVAARVGVRVAGSSLTNVALTLPFTRNPKQLLESAAFGAAMGFAPEVFGATRKGILDLTYKLTPDEGEGGLFSGIRSKVGNAILRGYTPSEALPGGETLTEIEGYGTVRGIPRDTLKSTMGGEELYGEFGGGETKLTHTSTFKFGENTETLLKGGGPRPGDTRDFYLAPPAERGGEAISYDFYGGREQEGGFQTKVSLGRTPKTYTYLFDQEVSILRPMEGEDYLSFRWREGTEGAGQVNVPHENWFYGQKELGGAQKWGFEWQLTAPASYRSQLFDVEGNPLVDVKGNPLRDIYVTHPIGEGDTPDLYADIGGKRTPLYKVENIFGLRGDETLYSEEGKPIETYEYPGSKLVTGEKLGWTIKQTLPEGRLGRIPVLRTLFSEYTTNDFIRASIQPVDNGDLGGDTGSLRETTGETGPLREGIDNTRELDVNEYNRRLEEESTTRYAYVGGRAPPIIPGGLFGGRREEQGSQGNTGDNRSNQGNQDNRGDQNNQGNQDNQSGGRGGGGRRTGGGGRRTGGEGHDRPTRHRYHRHTTTTTTQVHRHRRYHRHTTTTTTQVHRHRRHTTTTTTRITTRITRRHTNQETNTQQAVRVVVPTPTQPVAFLPYAGKPEKPKQKRGGQDPFYRLILHPLNENPFQVIGFYTEGRGRGRVVHPITRRVTVRPAGR